MHFRLDSSLQRFKGLIERNLYYIKRLTQGRFNAKKLCASVLVLLQQQLKSPHVTSFRPWPSKPSNYFNPKEIWKVHQNEQTPEWTYCTLLTPNYIFVVASVSKAWIISVSSRMHILQLSAVKSIGQTLHWSNHKPMHKKRAAAPTVEAVPVCYTLDVVVYE